jgi:hypothetical protein
MRDVAHNDLALGCPLEAPMQNAMGVAHARSRDLSRLACFDEAAALDPRVHLVRRAKVENEDMVGAIVDQLFELTRHFRAAARVRSPTAYDGGEVPKVRYRV